MRIGFEVWKAQVDAEVWRRAGVSLDDLPDVPTADWYEQGTKPATAARRAIAAARGDE